MLVTFNHASLSLGSAQKPAILLHERQYIQNCPECDDFILEWPRTIIFCILLMKMYIIWSPSCTYTCAPALQQPICVSQISLFYFCTCQHFLDLSRLHLSYSLTAQMDASAIIQCLVDKLDQNAGAMPSPSRCHGAMYQTNEGGFSC